MTRKVHDHTLKLMLETARAASINKETGDRWSRDHGYVVSSSGDIRMGRNTICHPSYDTKTSMGGAPPHGTYSIGRALSSHIAGMGPSTSISLIEELQERRAKEAREKPDAQERHMLASILGQLVQLRDAVALSRHRASLGGEVLADNIDWLDCFISKRHPNEN